MSNNKQTTPASQRSNENQPKILNKSDIDQTPGFDHQTPGFQADQTSPQQKRTTPVLEKDQNTFAKQKKSNQEFQPIEDNDYMLPEAEDPKEEFATNAPTSIAKPKKNQVGGGLVPRDDLSMANQSVGGATRLNHDFDQKSNFGGIERGLISNQDQRKSQQTAKGDDILRDGVKGLPQPDEHSRTIEAGDDGDNLVMSGDEKSPEKKQSTGFCNCFKKKVAVEEKDGELVDSIETNLDAMGKKILIGVYGLLQLGCMFCFAVYFYQFFMMSCNPSVHKMVDLGGAYFDTLIFGCTIVAILCKFASIICVALALDDYQNFEENGDQFIFAALFSLIPSTLLCPLYVYDHNYCLPRNFLIPFQPAQYVTVWTLLIAILLPVSLAIVGLPAKWKECCSKKNKRIQPQNIVAFVKQKMIDKAVQNLKEGGAEEAPKPGQTVLPAAEEDSISQKITRVMAKFLMGYVYMLIVSLFVTLCLIHIPQYKFFDGQIFMSGFTSELLALVHIAIIRVLYKQREITFEEVQLKMKMFEDSLAKAIQDKFKSFNASGKSPLGGSGIVERGSVQSGIQPQNQLDVQQRREQQKQLIDPDNNLANNRVGHKAFNPIKKS